MRWRRWLKYGKAKLDEAVRDADAVLDRKESELAAERAGKPWLTPSSDTPTLDEVKARIEDRAERAPQPSRAPRAPEEAPAERPTPTDAASDADAASLALELDAQRKAAEKRLAEIRKSLDLPARDDDAH